MTDICVWFDEKVQAYFWDDSEDHGGFDRCVPSGPFETQGAAITDAESIIEIDSVSDYAPYYYRESEND